MTELEAERKLSDRKKRVTNKRGPTSMGYTLPEMQAVFVLASCGHSKWTIATRSGMGIKKFNKACEADEKLSDAFNGGLAEEEHKIIKALLKSAYDPKNSKQVTSGTTLLKKRHGFTDGRSVAPDVSVTVNNTLKLFEPMSESKYTKLVTAAAEHAGNHPVLIEHDPVSEAARIENLDPIASVKAKQRAERTRS